MSPDTSLRPPTRETFAFLEETARLLHSQRDLSPNNSLINQSLTALVARLKTLKGTREEGPLLRQLKGHPLRTHLPLLCAHAEFQMELHWSRRIAQSPSPTAELGRFWYLGEYRALCDAEFSLIAQRPYARIVFLGAGPLPMSAILLSRRTQAPILCVDRHAQCLRQAGALIRALDIRNIQFHHHSAEAFLPHPDDLVIYAALLEGKGLHAPAHQSGTRQLLVRDAEGLWQLLYRPATLPAAPYREVARTPASNRHINISRLFVRD